MGKSYDKLTLCEEIRLLESLIFSSNVDWSYVCSTLENFRVEHCLTPRPQDDHSTRRLLIDLLLKSPPRDVVVAYVSLYPSSLYQNVAAFFAACKVGSSKIIRYLSQEIIKRGDSYECPYPWITMSHVTVKATKILLDEYPMGILQICEETDRCPLDHMILSSPGQSCPSDSPDYYKKLELMLQTSEFVTSGGRTQSAPIQTLLTIVLSKPEFFSKPRFACHMVQLFRQLQVLFPDLFRTQDCNGDFPLHVAIKVKCHPGRCYNEARDLIALLLDAHPEAARFVSTTRLPLHIALEQGWPCHDVLFKAAPEALHTHDTMTGLNSFQIAASSNVSWGISKKKKGISNIDVMYDLLRADPCQAMDML